MTLDASNPLAAPSRLPYQLPDFARLTPETFADALTAGMAEQLAALAALASDIEPATAANVLHPWDRSGALLERALDAFWAVKSSDTTDALDALAEEFAPRLSAHSDAIHLDRRLFDRLTELAHRADTGEVDLDEQDDWALRELLRSFVRAGVHLEGEAQERLRALNTRLAELGTAFDRANREARNAGGFAVTEAELAGLTDDEKAALRSEAGEYRLELVNTTRHPLLARLADRDVRRRLFEASTTRALAGEFDTRPLVVAMARARAERAALLGHPHHAALVAEAGCARDTAAVHAMMGRLGPAAVAQARREAERLATRFEAEYPGERFQAWDWEYVAEKVRAEEFDFDEADLAPYLQVDRVLDAVYAAAHDLYGITFEKRDDLRGHTPDTEVYEVRNDDGSPVGLFCLDFWARPTKEGGAWMTSLVSQSHLRKQLPVVTNDCNYTRATTTITWDGVITLFHEFGHALHGLFADSRYATRSGTATPPDFVEFPSQVNEHWARQPGRVLPAEWIGKLEAASRFGSGYETTEMMAATLLDQAWHSTPLAALPETPEEVEDFERRALESWGVAYDLVPPRYRTQYFSHIWGGGYAAGYYGYTWSEVMDADAVAWFDEHGGGTRANGEHFRRTLLAPGGSVDPMETWRRFRGRDPEVGPLLARLGLEL